MAKRKKTPPKRERKKPLRRNAGTGTVPTRNAEGLNPVQEAQLDELLEQIRPTLVQAVRQGAWMVSVFHMNGANVDMRRITKDFPTINFSKAVELLELSCIEERRKIREMEAGLGPDDFGSVGERI